MTVTELYKIATHTREGLEVLIIMLEGGKKLFNS